MRWLLLTILFLIISLPSFGAGGSRLDGAYTHRPDAMGEIGGDTFLLQVSSMTEGLLSIGTSRNVVLSLPLIFDGKTEVPFPKDLIEFNRNRFKSYKENYGERYDHVELISGSYVSSLEIEDPDENKVVVKVVATADVKVPSKDGKKKHHAKVSGEIRITVEIIGVVVPAECCENLTEILKKRRVSIWAGGLKIEKTISKTSEKEMTRDFVQHLLKVTDRWNHKDFDHFRNSRFDRGLRGIVFEDSLIDQSGQFYEPNSKVRELSEAISKDSIHREELLKRNEATDDQKKPKPKQKKKP